jgi:hypothetical protein
LLRESRQASPQRHRADYERHHHSIEDIAFHCSPP